MALIPVKIDRTIKPPLGTPLRTDGHWSVQGIVGAWAFNESAGTRVWSGTNANHGLVVNAPVWQVDALDFDGTSQRVNIGSGKITTSTKGYFAALIRVDSDATSTPRAIIGFGSSGSNNGLRIGICNTGTGINYLHIFDRGTTYNLRGNTILTFGSWFFVEAIATGATGGWKLYVNGAEETLTAIAGSNLGTWFGGITAAGTNYFSFGAVQRYGIWEGFFPGAIAFALLSDVIPQQLLSANPWQIYEPETVWIDVGGATVFEGSISGDITISQSLSGQLGCGGGMSATAGSAAYSCAALEGKQGPIVVSMTNLAQTLTGIEGKQGAFLISLGNTTQSFSGNSGNSAYLTAQLAAISQSLSGQNGSSGTLSAGVATLSALFGEQVVFQGTISAAMSALSGSISGVSGNVGQVLSSISLSSIIAGATGNAGLLQSTLDSLVAQLSGVMGVSGPAALSISTGLEMAGKLGVSASIASELADMGAYLVEVIIGDRIHRIVISTKTGAAVILTKTGHINITTQ